MKECDILGEQNILWSPPTYCQGAKTPNSPCPLKLEGLYRIDQPTQGVVTQSETPVSEHVASRILTAFKMW